VLLAEAGSNGEEKATELMDGYCDMSVWKCSIGKSSEGEKVCMIVDLC